MILNVSKTVITTRKKRKNVSSHVYYPQFTFKDPQKNINSSQ